MLHSTDHFLDKINNFKFIADHKLVSFDVQSLFTNVSLDETKLIVKAQSGKSAVQLVQCTFEIM